MRACALKSTVMHLVLQPPQPVDSFPQLVDTSEMASPICKPQWAWLEDDHGIRTWQRLPPGPSAMQQFQAGSRLGLFVDVASEVPTGPEEALLKQLWDKEVLTSGTRLAVVPKSLREAHWARLTMVHEASNLNARANGCHEMFLVSATSDRPAEKQRFNCRSCTLSRIPPFHRRAWRERCGAWAPAP